MDETKALEELKKALDKDKEPKYNSDEEALDRIESLINTLNITEEEKVILTYYIDKWFGWFAEYNL